MKRSDRNLAGLPCSPCLTGDKLRRLATWLDECQDKDSRSDSDIQVDLRRVADEMDATAKIPLK